MIPTTPGYQLATDVYFADARRSEFDLRWVLVGALVLGLTGIGVFYAQYLDTSRGLSLSAKTSMIYCPLAAALILTLGWTPRWFPVAAGLFYGYLGLGQAASDSFFFLGGEQQGALTFEMLLALPLLAVAFGGQPALPARHDLHMPPYLKVAWILILCSALLSTVLALDPTIAFATFCARFLLPIGVTIGCYRRLRNIQDYQVVWFGFLVGMVLIGAFGYRRAVLGVSAWYSTVESQRFLGAAGSYAIAAIYAAGIALWYGHTLASRTGPVRGMALMLVAGVITLLIWLGAHRGPTVAMGIIILWWLPGHFLKNMFRGKGLLITLVGAAALAYVVKYSLSRTTLEAGMVLERLEYLLSGGLTETSRFAIWTYAIESWARSPLWGVGLNNWRVVNQQFDSIHGSAAGILFDMGLIGAIAFALFFGQVILLARKTKIRSLSPVDRSFFLGARASWVAMTLVLMVNLPFTSGLPKNTVLIYMVFFFPLLAMVVHSRHPAEPEPAVAPRQAPATNQSYSQRPGAAANG